MNREQLNEMIRLQQAYDLEMAKANSESAEGLQHYVKAAVSQYSLYTMSSGVSAQAHLEAVLALIQKVHQGMDALGIRREKKEPDQEKLPQANAPKTASGTVVQERATDDAEKLPVKRPLEEVMKELNDLIGMENIKKDVSELVAWMKNIALRKKRNLPITEPSLHMVFTGNPGTGKTTVARLIAEIYYSLGLLKKGHLVEVDRSGMVGAYQGHTEKKVEELVQRSLGGMLFIDEAYALSSGQHSNDFGMIAIHELLKAMEDHRGELVVVAAGYPAPMDEFLKSNPGLTSRFSRHFHFEDYKPEELVDIFKMFCRKGAYQLDAADGSEEFLKEHFAKLYMRRDEHFGNGRVARNYFEKVLVKQALRLDRMEAGQINDAELTRLTITDLREAAEDEE